MRQAHSCRLARSRKILGPPGTPGTEARLLEALRGARDFLAQPAWEQTGKMLSAPPGKSASTTALERKPGACSSAMEITSPPEGHDRYLDRDAFVVHLNAYEDNPERGD